MLQPLAQPLYLAFFLGINLAAAAFLFKRFISLSYRIDCESGKLQESSNLLEHENAGERAKALELAEKARRYACLKDVIVRLNSSLESDRVAEALVNEAHAQVSGNRGSCLLYFINKELDLQLRKSRHEEGASAPGEKRGDIFDSWVLRHSSALMVEDCSDDFRFDPGKQGRSRPLGSLISAPIISEHRFFGTLRLDHPLPRAFTQDDLRLLSTVCDLGAVALENSELFLRIRELAIHDSLTLLHSKGYFLERLKEECVKCRRSRRPLSLLMLDIDRFKEYNDNYGHAAGDIVLKRLAELLRGQAAASGALEARYGGEEFCLLLSGIAAKEALSLASGLLAAVGSQKILLRQQETRVTVSIGLASLGPEVPDDIALLDKADKAMYRAKQEGRNRVCSL